MGTAGGDDGESTRVEGVKLERGSIRSRGSWVRPLLLAGAAVLSMLALMAAAGSAGAATANFPLPVPPATQITRELTLPQAARAGVAKLSAKGGGEGDAVQLEVDGTKKIHAPIVVTIHMEITTPTNKTPEQRSALLKVLKEELPKVQAEMDRSAYKARNGDPIRIQFDFRYREAEVPPSPGYHQVTVIQAGVDLPPGGTELDPDFRPEVEEMGTPNGPVPTNATFPSSDLSTGTFLHEGLHMAGLDDRYHDVYNYKGKDYPLPSDGMAPKELKTYLRDLSKPLPPPPAGKVVPRNLKGTGRCDVMGVAADDPCRKISKRDLKWIERQAGLVVTAEPGELLLNKDPKAQNMAVAYRTKVLARAGAKTVAPGVAAYCLDHDRVFPLDQGFDVGPSAVELPAYEGVLKLMRLNAQIQPDLKTSVLGMQAAVWNLTDATPLATSGTAEESRALMAQAGVVEDSVPGGLAALTDPNAASPETGAVDPAGALLPAIATEPTEPASLVELFTAQLVSKKLRAGGALTNYLLVGAGGPVSGISLKLQHRAGKKWKPVRKLPNRKLDDEPGIASLKLKLGRLAAGSYRLLVTVSATTGEAASAKVGFAVKP